MNLNRQFKKKERKLTTGAPLSVFSFYFWSVFWISIDVPVGSRVSLLSSALIQVYPPSARLPLLLCSYLIPGSFFYIQPFVVASWLLTFWVSLPPHLYATRLPFLGQWVTWLSTWFPALQLLGRKSQLYSHRMSTWSHQFTCVPIPGPLSWPVHLGSPNHLLIFIWLLNIVFSIWCPAFWPHLLGSQ